MKSRPESEVTDAIGQALRCVDEALPMYPAGPELGLVQDRLNMRRVAFGVLLREFLDYEYSVGDGSCTGMLRLPGFRWVGDTVSVELLQGLFSVTKVGCSVRDVRVGDRVVIRGMVLQELGPGWVLVWTGPGSLDGVAAPVSAVELVGNGNVTGDVLLP